MGGNRPALSALAVEVGDGPALDRPGAPRRGGNSLSRAPATAVDPMAEIWK